MAQPTQPESDPKKPSRRFLSRRITVPGTKNQNPDSKLARDVTAPGWLRSFGGYFTGAYREVRQVRWPNRRATWSLTGAVLVFTAVMAGFVLALDFAFESLFKRIIT